MLSVTLCNFSNHLCLSAVAFSSEEQQAHFLPASENKAEREKSACSSAFYFIRFFVFHWILFFACFQIPLRFINYPSAENCLGGGEGGGEGGASLLDCP